LGAGTLLGIVLPAVVFAIGWLIDRVRGDELIDEAINLLFWCPLLGASMGVAFWVVRYPLAARVLGDISDVYAPAGSVRVDEVPPRRKRVVRWLLFWVVFGAGFGLLTAVCLITVSFPLVVVFVGSVGLMESIESQGFLWGLWSTTLNIWQELLLEIEIATLSEFAEPLVYGAFVGPFLWALLLLVLRRVAVAR
jgi:hypothetical protein